MCGFIFVEIKLVAIFKNQYLDMIIDMISSNLDMITDMFCVGSHLLSARP